MENRPGPDYRRTEPPMNPRPSGNRAMLYLTGAAAAGGLAYLYYTRWGKEDRTRSRISRDLKEVKSATKETAKDVTAAAKEKAGEMKQAAKEIAKDIKTAAQTSPTVERMKGAAAQTAVAAKETVQEAKEKASDLFEVSKEKTRDLGHMAEQKLEEMKDKMMDLTGLSDTERLRREEMENTARKTLHLIIMQQEMKERGREMEKQAKEGYEKVVGTVERRAEDLKSKGYEMGGKAKETFEHMKEKAERGVEEMKEKAKETYEQMKDTASRGTEKPRLGGMGEKARNTWEETRHGAAVAGHSAADTARAVGEDIKYGVASMKDNLKYAVKDTRTRSEPQNTPIDDLRAFKESAKTTAANVAEDARQAPFAAENLKTTASNVAEDLRGGIQRAREEIRQPPAPGAYAYPTETRPLSIYESTKWDRYMDVPTSLTGTDIGGMVREDFERSRAGMGGLGSAASEPRPGYISPQEAFIRADSATRDTSRSTGDWSSVQGSDADMQAFVGTMLSTVGEAGRNAEPIYAMADSS